MPPCTCLREPSSPCRFRGGSSQDARKPGICSGQPTRKSRQAASRRWSGGHRAAPQGTCSGDVVVHTAPSRDITGRVHGGPVAEVHRAGRHMARENTAPSTATRRFSLCPPRPTNSTCTNLLTPSRHSRGPDPVRRKVLSVVRRSFPPSSMEQAWFAGQEPDQAGDSTSMPASAAAERSRLS